MGRLAGIDYGSRRIGLALSDSGQHLASPVKVLQATGRIAEDARIVLAWARAEEVAGFVVGLPLNMDGTAGPQVALIRRFGAELEAAGRLPVLYVDERLSSFAADVRLEAAELTRRGRRRRQDAVAAQIILENYLRSQPG